MIFLCLCTRRSCSSHIALRISVEGYIKCITSANIHVCLCSSLTKQTDNVRKGRHLAKKYFLCNDVVWPSVNILNSFSWHPFHDFLWNWLQANHLSIPKTLHETTSEHWHNSSTPSVLWNSSALWYMVKISKNYSLRLLSNSSNILGWKLAH